MLNSQVIETDDAKRVEYLTEAMNVINEDVPIYVYSYPNWMFTVNNRITGGLEMPSTWIWSFFVKDITLG